MTIPERLPISARQILRAATEEDIPAMVNFERIPEFRTMVGNWPAAEHLRALGDPDMRYFMVIDENGAAAGFAILRGLLSSHRNIELKRFVIGRPGTGLGQQALHALMDHVFSGLHAHRLWLDVFETNARAQHVYRKAGFRQEGILREAIYRDGEFHSLLLMSLLDREYLSGGVP